MIEKTTLLVTTVVVHRPWLTPPPIRYCHSANDTQFGFIHGTGHGILQLCTIIEVYSCKQLCRLVVVVLLLLLLHTIPVTNVTRAFINLNKTFVILLPSYLLDCRNFEIFKLGATRTPFFLNNYMFWQVVHHQYPVLIPGGYLDSYPPTR